MTSKIRDAAWAMAEAITPWERGGHEIYHLVCDLVLFAHKGNSAREGLETAIERLTPTYNWGPGTTIRLRLALDTFMDSPKDSKQTTTERIVNSGA